jgi:hypothetical protein
MEASWESVAAGREVSRAGMRVERRRLMTATASETIRESESGAGAMGRMIRVRVRGMRVPRLYIYIDR